MTIEPRIFLGAYLLLTSVLFMQKDFPRKYTTSFDYSLEYPSSPERVTPFIKTDSFPSSLSKKSFPIKSHGSTKEEYDSLNPSTIKDAHEMQETSIIHKTPLQIKKESSKPKPPVAFHPIHTDYSSFLETNKPFDDIPHSLSTPLLNPLISMFADDGNSSFALCKKNEDCEKGQFCKKYGSNVCFDEEIDGKCIFLPTDINCTEAAPQIICGCDGKEYQSICEANMIGVNVHRYGSCTDEDIINLLPINVVHVSDYQLNISHVNENGCGVDIDCPSGAFCLKEDGQCSFGFGHRRDGECVISPKECKSHLSHESESKATVCGCDGRTYSSRCEAMMNRISIKHKGKCN